MSDANKGSELKAERRQRGACGSHEDEKKMRADSPAMSDHVFRCREIVEKELIGKSGADISQGTFGQEGWKLLIKGQGRCR
jgi:hypothetical protein